MKRFKYIIGRPHYNALRFASCSEWTEPENLDFRHQTPEEIDPAAYEAYLSTIREYKKTEHNLMFVTMKGSADHPSSQNQHLMAMPDSADFVVVDIDDALNTAVVSEIPQLLQRKGTEALLFIDYARIHTAWGLLEDKRADEGNLQEPLRKQPSSSQSRLRSNLTDVASMVSTEL